MGNELGSFPGFGFSDSGFENNLAPTFGVRLNKRSKDVEVFKNNKCIQKIPMASFPAEVSFDNVAHISAIIKIVREDGLVGLMTHYKLK